MPAATASRPPAPKPSQTPELLYSPLLASQSWLRHGFSTRRAGRSNNFDLAHSKDNQRRFLRAVAPDPGAELVQLRQIHGSLVWRDPRPGRAGDAMLTRKPGQYLAIRTADCCPILLADSRHRAVAAVHAGWRGTLARVVEKTLGEMRAAFGTEPNRVLAAIGPCIRGCCYEVGEEVVAAFASQFDYAAELFQAAEDDPVRSRYPMLFLTGAPPGHPYDPRWNRETPRRLDLALANRRQLERAGVSAASIEVLPFCTHCQPERFFSHRAGAAGRMLAAIGIPGPKRPRKA